MTIGKALALVFVVLVFALYFFAGGERFLNLEFYQDLYSVSPLKTGLIFFLVFLLGTSFSLPVSAALSIVSGIIFGPLIGFGLSTFAGALGATFALLVTRYLLRDFMIKKFSAPLATINKGVDEEGAFYLFSLRLVPVVPFWLLNLLVGLTGMPVRTFFITTFVGMMPITAMLVYAGVQLGQITDFSLKALLSPTLLGIFCLIAVFPFVMRFTLRKLRKQRVCK